MGGGGAKHRDGPRLPHKSGQQARALLRQALREGGSHTHSAGCLCTAKPV